MNQYRVLEQIDATHEGTIRLSDDAKVHLAQGDADGACGPYSVFMCLLILGLASREELAGWGFPDGRTKVGKLVKAMGRDWTTLFREGTDLDDLQTLLRKSFPNDVHVERTEEAGRPCIAFVVEHVRLNRPVVLRIDGPGVSHFVVAVGLDETPEPRGPTVNRVLVLDPGSRDSQVCPWNGVIDARGSGGPFPYTWWTAGDSDPKVQFVSALAIWSARKDSNP